eukprot:9501948-Pyramimonas_sp.AAC.2
MAPPAPQRTWAAAPRRRDAMPATLPRRSGLRPRRARNQTRTPRTSDIASWSANIATRLRPPRAYTPRASCNGIGAEPVLQVLKGRAVELGGAGARGHHHWGIRQSPYVATNRARLARAHVDTATGSFGGYPLRSCEGVPKPMGDHNHWGQLGPSEAPQ